MVPSDLDSLNTAVKINKKFSTMHDRQENVISVRFI